MAAPLRARNWLDYLAYDRESLLGALGETCQELASLHKEHAMVAADEKAAAIEGFARSQGDSVTARNRDADFQSLKFTKEAIDLDGKIKACREERDFLRLVIGTPSDPF